MDFSFFSFSYSFSFSFFEANKTRLHFTGINHTRLLICSLLTIKSESALGNIAVYAEGMELEVTHSR